MLRIMTWRRGQVWYWQQGRCAHSVAEGLSLSSDHLNQRLPGQGSYTRFPLLLFDRWPEGVESTPCQGNGTILLLIAFGWKSRLCGRAEQSVRTGSIAIAIAIALNLNQL